MKRIEAIRLEGVLPKVFVGDEAQERPSDVWRTSLTLQRGKNYCINAASGTGKTSLCSFLMGVRHDYIGSICFDDKNISKFTHSDWADIRCHNLAYLPQELGLFDELTALENVLLKNRLTDFKTEQEIRQMFERLGIDHRINQQAGRLSVGQKQRVALIRALCQPFDFLLLDEPVSHLDLYNNEKCGELAVEAAEAQQASIIFTSVGNPLKINAPYIPLNI